MKSYPIKVDAVNQLVDGPNPSGGAIPYSTLANIKKTPIPISTNPAAIKMLESQPEGTAGGDSGGLTYV